MKKILLSMICFVLVSAPAYAALRDKRDSVVLSMKSWAYEAIRQTLSFDSVTDNADSDIERKARRKKHFFTEQGYQTYLSAMKLDDNALDQAVDRRVAITTVVKPDNAIQSSFLIKERDYDEDTGLWRWKIEAEIYVFYSDIPWSQTTLDLPLNNIVIAEIVQTSAIPPFDFKISKWYTRPDYDPNQPNKSSIINQITNEID